MKKLKAIFLLVIFLSSIVGYSFEMHYCKGQITDVSFIGHAECVCVDGNTTHETESQSKTCKKSCHDEELKVNLNKDNFKDTGCCKTKQVTYMSSTVKALSSSELPLIIAIVATINPLYFIGSPNLKAKSFNHYSSPVLIKDITILVRTFLI